MPGFPGKKGPRGSKGEDFHHYINRTGNSVYTRWGRESCPGVAGTKLLYTGLLFQEDFSPQQCFFVKLLQNPS